MVEWGTRLPRRQEKLCKFCQKPFYPQGKNPTLQVYCSADCRKARNKWNEDRKRRNKPVVVLSRTTISERSWQKIKDGEVPDTAYLYDRDTEKAPLDAVSDHERVPDESAEVLYQVSHSQLLWAHRLDHNAPDDPYIYLDILLEARKTGRTEQVSRHLSRGHHSTARREDGGPGEPEADEPPDGDGGDVRGWGGVAVPDEPGGDPSAPRREPPRRREH